MINIIATKEVDIQRTVCDYLARKKHFFSRINNTPIYDPVGKFFRALPKYTLKGFPDVLVLWKGYPVFLEIKTTKGKQSPEQIEFQARCKEQGIEYWVIRKLEDVIAIGL